MNPLKLACTTPSRCSASAGTSNIPDATDQNVYTGAFVPLPAGTPAGSPGAFVQANMLAPGTVTRVSVKGFGNAPLNLVLIKARTIWEIAVGRLAAGRVYFSRLGRRLAMHCLSGVRISAVRPPSAGRQHHGHGGHCQLPDRQLSVGPRGW